MKRSPINKKSVKQAEREKEYYGKTRPEFLEKNPNCELCGAKSTDVHHRKGRNGNRLNDVSMFMSLCRNCHHKVETNRAWAKKNDFIITRKLEL